MFKVGDEVYVKAQVVDTDVKAFEGYNHKVQFLDSINNEWDWVSQSAISDKTYEQGLADAWELARKIQKMPPKDFRNIFGDIGNTEMMLSHSYDEALAKIEAYEREKEIKVGDEIVHGMGSHENKLFVTSISDGMVKGFEINEVSFTFPNQFIQKTGKHIDIEGLLRQIGE